MRLPDPARSRAVLIGVGRYTDPNLADLPAVTNNLNDLARVLTDRRLGGLRRERCAILRDPADERSVGTALMGAARQAEDVFLVYYAGHGVVGPRRNELYLALTDTDPESLFYTALPFEGVREAFLASRATSRVLILDCCYSGRAIEEHMADADSFVLGQVEVAGTYTLTSVPANSLAFAPKGATHTAFSGQLLALLREGTPDGPELLPLGVVYRHVLRAMTVQGLPCPQQRGTETADLLALTRNPRHPRTPPEPSEREPIPVVREVVAKQEQELGAPTFGARRELAYWVGLRGDQLEAERLFEELIADEERVLGPDGRETLIGRYEQACWIARSGNHARAVRLLQALVADEERVLGADDTETLAGRFQLAMSTRSLAISSQSVRERELSNAEHLFRMLLADQERISGPNDSRTLEIRHYLAECVAWNGNNNEARRLLQAVVRDRERVLGRDHPATLESRHSLAHRQDDPADALRLFREVALDWERVLGPDYHDALDSRFWVAYWTARTGDEAGAIPQLQSVIADIERALGPGHLSIWWDARCELALWTKRTGKTTEAARLYRELIADLEKSTEFGPDHPMTLDCRYMYAMCIAETGDAEAAQMFQNLILDIERVQGADNVSALQVRYILADFTAWLGDKDESGDTLSRIAH